MIEDGLYLCAVRLIRIAADTGGINPVSPEEFTSRMLRVWAYLKQFIGAIIVPFALFGMSVSVLVFIVSSFARSENGKKYGLGGLIGSLSALFLYWITPLLAGIVSNVAKIINGG